MDGLDDLTKDELYERAQEADIEGRSEMTKDELIEALTDVESDDAPAPATAPVNPLRPVSGVTAPVPARSDQPGLGRSSVAERDPRLGPTPNMSIGRKGEAIRRRKALREESLAGD